MIYKKKYPLFLRLDALFGSYFVEKYCSERKLEEVSFESIENSNPNPEIVFERGTLH